MDYYLYSMCVILAIVILFSSLVVAVLAYIKEDKAKYKTFKYNLKGGKLGKWGEGTTHDIYFYLGYIPKDFNVVYSKIHSKSAAYEEGGDIEFDEIQAYKTHDVNYKNRKPNSVGLKTNFITINGDRRINNDEKLWEGYSNYDLFKLDDGMIDDQKTFDKVHLYAKLHFQNKVYRPKRVSLDIDIVFKGWSVPLDKYEDKHMKGLPCN